MSETSTGLPQSPRAELADDESAPTGPSAAGTAETDGDKGKKKAMPEIPVSEIATITSQADLDAVLAAHQKWVDGTLNPNVEVAAGRANLVGVDLRGLSLRGANLSGANLSGANLAEVDLTGANLTAANCTGAVLACANLSGAKMRLAKIAGADMRGADLTGAYVTGLDFSKAVMKTEERGERKGASAEPPPASASTQLAPPVVDDDAAAPASNAAPADPAGLPSPHAAATDRALAEL